MRKQAFTLLETMVALGIVVLALGASASVNRALILGGQVSEDVFHATELADESIEMMRATHGYILNIDGPNKTLEYAIGVQSTGDNFFIPYRAPDSRIAWCGLVRLLMTNCDGVTSKIGDGTQTIRADLLGGGAETIAINRSNTSGSGVDYRNAVSYTTGDTFPFNLVPSSSNCTVNCQWDYYKRLTTVKKLPAGFLGSGTTGSAYQVSVRVENIVTNTTVNRTILLTDFGVTGNSGANITQSNNVFPSADPITPATANPTSMPITPITPGGGGRLPGGTLEPAIPTNDDLSGDALFDQFNESLTQIINAVPVRTPSGNGR